MVFRKIVSRIKEIINSNSQRVFVAIDGVDASGKTHFAQKLKEKLDEVGIKSQIISIDDFHHEKKVRYERGQGFSLSDFIRILMIIRYFLRR